MPKQLSNLYKPVGGMKKNFNSAHFATNHQTLHIIKFGYNKVYFTDRFQGYAVY